MEFPSIIGATTKTYGSNIKPPPSFSAGKSAGQPLSAPNSPSWEKKRAMLQDKYSPEETSQLLAGQNPIKADTVQYVRPVQKSGAGLAQKGLSVSPDSLEMLRAQGTKDSTITDDFIADEMAKSSTHFSTQLTKIRKKYGGDPDAVSAFLNMRFYGDTQYNPVSKTTSTGSPQPKSNHPVARALDWVYGVAKNTVNTDALLGQGGIMQRYNTGEMGAGDAAIRAASSIFHNATTPVREPAIAAGNFALAATGGDKLLQDGMQGIMESQIGQSAAPIVQGAIQGYQDLPQDSNVRNLGAAGQSALDALEVLGAAQAVGITKRAAAAPFQWKSYRHPFITGKEILMGKLPPDGGGGGGGGAVGGRDLSWERNPLAEGRPGV